MGLLLQPIEDCDRCAKTVSMKSALMVGDTRGVRKQSWWVLCPKCHWELTRKYVNKMQVSKRMQTRLGMDAADIKGIIEKSARFWHKDF